MSVDSSEICLCVSLSEQEALDLAQFLKRTGFADYCSQAVDDEGAYRMRAVAEKVRRNLVAIGYDPR
ncbi:hypothetical protein U737_13230 [Methylomonas sp. LW13]|uniref:DUF7706 family protein n=1 Tax=unclassified Methylomonas TaxID=2608980 RepID=UPI00051B1475|nr:MULTISPECIES: hypothetical protein [unclassified Methylomonas]PKD39581.1 hypothetical protein CWO84_14675 [Methylomonas sp. Kb3]QBC27790.1 hypothetical protein U737_13230 [Methylomonas sp. LW13]